jgi:hypothetical protein
MVHKVFAITEVLGSNSENFMRIDIVVKGVKQAHSAEYESIGHDALMYFFHLLLEMKVPTNIAIRTTTLTHKVESSALIDLVGKINPKSKPWIATPGNSTPIPDREREKQQLSRLRDRIGLSQAAAEVNS